MPEIKNKSQKGRFILVGVCNTVIDFSILFTLKALGLPAVPSNIVSTSAAFIFSFFANKNYTFKSKGGNLKRQLILFVIVTLFGLWVLQTIVIAVMTSILATTSLDPAIKLLIAKLLATIVSLIWNYTMYARVVFKNTDPDMLPKN